MKLAYIDTETTGLDSRKNGIHQLSLIIDLVDEHTGEIKMVEKHDFKINPAPSLEINDDALKVSGAKREDFPTYDSEDVFKRKFCQILGKYCDKFNKKDKFYLVGYNVQFDSEMLKALFERCNDPYMHSWFFFPSVDVAQIALPLIGNAIRIETPSFNLTTCAKLFGITLDENRMHDALYDIEVTREVLLKTRWIAQMISTSVKKENECPSPVVETKAEEQQIAKSNNEDGVINDKKFVITFGKYKNQTVESIIKENASYILWIQRERILDLVFGENIIKEATEYDEKQNAEKKQMFEKSKYRNYEGQEKPYGKR